MVVHHIKKSSEISVVAGSFVWCTKFPLTLATRLLSEGERHHSDVLRMGESGPQETLSDETEEIARRLQTVIYIDISVLHTAA
jgi:hypothetical protein